MSEEIKKEAQDTELNPNELEQVSGGWTDPFEREERFVFSKEEMEKMEKGICPICNKRIESGTGFMKIWEHAKNCKG